LHAQHYPRDDLPDFFDAPIKFLFVDKVADLD